MRDDYDLITRTFLGNNQAANKRKWKKLYSVC